MLHTLEYTFASKAYINCGTDTQKRDTGGSGDLHLLKLTCNILKNSPVHVETGIHNKLPAELGASIELLPAGCYYNSIHIFLSMAIYQLFRLHKKYFNV